ncbi:RagB/SusD family nutrient uptake outer membrane protein [Palleniella muris]|uniref:RagB/SusD family nutrient uptake outer membrane protein n=1 Tax=Palleniella muris TaxID=3038145 RepID=UPI00240FD158|nr:RagB/SusD family nutrient uptake outer membrane protein [Palleniella muris]
MNYIYQKSLPYAKGANNTTDNFYPDLWPVGMKDALSGNTDEFTGYGEYNDPSKTWDNTTVHKYFFYGINESPWKKIRECNDVIQRCNESATLTQQQKEWCEGQARFFRASRYFRLFKRYGGVPIVKELQSTVDGDRDKLAVPRNSTEDTYKFIIDDLVTAGNYLPARWEEEANDWGRITAGACYALAGYVANYYASPVFNRKNETERWEEAYRLNLKAVEMLQNGNFGLAYEEDPGVNASNWAKIWCTITGSTAGGGLSEDVFIANCNNTADSEGNNRFNAWEQSIRPANANGGGGITPSAEMVDLFPMADGKRPKEAGEYVYDKTAFFLNRDPRFYRTFAFPGVEWRYTGNLSQEKLDQCPYLDGNTYKLMNFAWYSSIDEVNDSQRAGYFSDKLGNSGRTVYVRKKSQDSGLGENALYVFEEDGGFKRNAQSVVVICYAEVLLNLAEAACGAGHGQDAFDALLKVRQRVYGKNAGDCGLDRSIIGDKARMFEAILYERQIELAYEGKRFDDCHRWMLFDGGVTQGEIQADWVPSGWGGNTCAYLGVTPLNEVVRHQLELHFDPTIFTGEKTNDLDPFETLGIKRPTALTLRENMTAKIDEQTGEMVYADARVGELAKFYGAYLVRKDIETMVSTAEMGINPIWDNIMYLMGLAASDQENNPGVVQTVGWQSRFGGMGIFDPLSKSPKVGIEDEENTSSESSEVLKK